MVKKSNNAIEQYENEIKQAEQDSKLVVESTEQMIDMPFFDFVTYLEGRNIGELKAFRTLMQAHLDKADMYAKKLVDTHAVANNTKEQIVQIGSIFGIVNKIVDRMGYMDYLIKKNSIH